MVAYDPANDSWTNQFSQPQAAANPAAPGGDLYSAWASAAPSLPTNLLHQFATSGISPADPVGSWVIRTGVPALGSTNPIGNSLTEGSAAERVLGNPQLLAQIKKLPLDKQTTIFQMSAAQAGALSDQDLQRLAQTGSTHVHHSIFNRIGDALTTGARDTFTVLSAPMELAQAGNRAISADFAATRDTLHIPSLIKDKAHYDPTVNPLDEVTGVQALQGNSLGNGFFPAGPARAAAVAAQEQAASINGHALTPGRALASAVVQPGTRPYSILSGIVDTTIALKGDPSVLALGELSDAVKAARTFAPTSFAARLSAAKFIADGVSSGEGMTALRSWTGLAASEEPDIVTAISQKIKADPGSLQQLVGHPDLGFTFKDIAAAVGRDHTGGVQALRNLVDRPTALSWLNSKAGVDYAQWAADSGFRDIWLNSSKKMPVDVAAQLHDATSADQVRTILGNELGTLVRNVPEGVMPYAWKRPYADLRLAQYLPRGTIDIENPDNAVDQVHRTLMAAKVDPAFHDDLLADVAKAGNRSQFYNAYTNALDAVKDTLVQRGVDPDLAHTLTRFTSDQSIEDQARYVAQVADAPHTSGLAVAGDTTPIMGPHLPSELLNRALPVINMRDVNRNVGTWGDIWNHPVVGPIAKTATYAADAITGAFKVGALLKGALPVRFLADEQARMATAGLDSMWNHPWRLLQDSGVLDADRHNPLALIAHVIGTPESSQADLMGVSWADQLADNNSAYARAVGQSSHWDSTIWDAPSQLDKGYTTYRLNTPAGLRSWGDELSHLYMSPVSRETARALADVGYIPDGASEGVAGLDAVKQSFWDGPLARYRNELVDARLTDPGWMGGTSSVMGSSRAAADHYIDTVVDRIRSATSDHPELTDAVAHGGPFSANGITKDFKLALGDYRAEGLGPELIRGRKLIATGGNPQPFRAMVDRMLSGLMDTPTKTLTRSPAFKQMYLRRLDELSPYITDGTIDAAKADTLAKAHGLQAVRDLLYYPGERTGATAKLRNIAPFGEAWRNVLKTWTTLGAQNPQVFRRVEQGVQSLRDGGFIYPDPQSGKEVFNMVPAGIMKHLSGVPFAMTAPVAGVNIVGSGLPGVGPAVQMTADALLSKGNVVTDTLRQHLLPYGSPDYTGGTFETLFPGWLDKLRTSQFLLHYLPGNPQLPFLTPSTDKRRVLTDLAQSVFGYHMSAGNYDLTDPAVLNRLTKQSMWEAQKLYLLRSLGQFISPSAPNDTPMTQNADGSLIETWKLTSDFRTMEKAYGSLDQATLAFVNKYGPKAIFATESHAQRAPFAIPTTEEANIWKDQHSAFAAENPNTFAYWAPTQGQFSYETYLDQIKSGALVPRSVQDWAKLADARLGNAIYSTLRSRLPASPTQDQRNWLDAQKQQITAQYPGFNQDSLKLARLTTDQTITEMKQAVNNPAVAQTPLAQAARTYLQLRDEALATARARTGSQGTGLSGKSMADLRAWLYENGTKITLQAPDFQTMWNDVFLNEVQPPEENQ